MGLGADSVKLSYWQFDCIRSHRLRKCCFPHSNILYKRLFPKSVKKLYLFGFVQDQCHGPSSYNAHTDELFKRYSFLKYVDIVTLNQCVFMRQYSNKQLPMSFQDMFKYLPLSQQVFRDHDYNFIPKEVTWPHLKFYPIVQMLKTWNASNIFVKSETENICMKETFITQCLSGYEEECLKPRCYVCNRS